MSGEKFPGRVKYIGIDNGAPMWKMGALEINKRSNGSWCCSIYYDCSSKERPKQSFMISAKNINQVLYKKRFVLQLDKSVDIHFVPNYAPVMNELQKIMNEVIGSKSDENMTTRVPELNRESQTVTKMVPYTFNGSGRKVCFVKETDTPLKSPKENKRLSNGCENGAFELFNESKENQYSGPVGPVTPEQFLKRGSDKSREKLKSLSTGGFYSEKSTSTPMITSNVSSSKRSLGFLSEPSPVKRSRLSDCSYSWSKNKSISNKEESVKTTSFHGFSNLGNTCYMNATLQSLFGLDTFATDVLYGNRHLMHHLSSDSLYYHLAKLLRARKNNNLSDSLRREFLRNVKRAISTSAKRFSGYLQHDAHEFLGQVLDQLKEEVNKIEKQNSAITPRKELNNNRDLINPTVQNFEFEVLHSITCVQCEEEVEKLENFNDLSLDMPKRNKSSGLRSIQDALNVFLDKEVIDYACSKCGHNKSEVTHKFTSLPRILVLQLKRSRYDTVALKNGKVAQSIQIPQLLSLSYFCNEETVPCSSTPNTSPNFRFRKISQGSENVSKSDEDLSSLVAEWDDLIKDKGDEEDSDLAKAIELSLAQQKQGADDETEDEQLAKVLELSKRDGPTNTTDINDFCSNPELEKLTEEERIELAIEESLRQSQKDSIVNASANSVDEIDLTCDEDKENLFDEAENTLEEKEEGKIKKFEAEREFPFAQYRLVSIVNHIGSSSEVGHYISDVFDLRKQTWNSFDDANVTPITETEVSCKREKSGYIFFYMNKEICDDMTRMYSSMSAEKS